MVNSEKLSFLKKTFPELLKKLSGDENPEWGKMNPQQMIEHMTDSFRIADEKKRQSIHTPAEQLDAYKRFLMSDKEFKPLTKNPLLGEQPAEIINTGIEEAIRELEDEISFFVSYFEKEQGKITTHGVFGDLNYEEWVQMLHKHAVHHLKQFRLI